MLHSANDGPWSNPFKPHFRVPQQPLNGPVNSLDSLNLSTDWNATRVARLQRGPLARQSRLNALSQIEKNFSKEVRKREDQNQGGEWFQYRAR